MTSYLLLMGNGTAPESWSVGCFGFNSLLRQYFSLYRAVSQKGERKEKRQMRGKVSKHPQPTLTASAIGLCPTTFKLVGHPTLKVYLAPLLHPTIPTPERGELLKERICSQSAAMEFFPRESRRSLKQLW